MKRVISTMVQWVCLMGILMGIFCFFSLHSIGLNLVFDTFLETTNTRTFHQMNEKHIELLNAQIPCDGLNTLLASGSGQFSEQGFIEITKLLPIPINKLIVIDLRQESHGFFNSLPVSWHDGVNNYANIGKTKEQIEKDEEERLKALPVGEKIPVIIYKTHGDIVQYELHNYRTEREFMQELGVTYIRLPITDHNHPSDEAIEEFIDLVNQREPDQWFHLHCRAGKGRTTSFLVFLDIIKNATQISLDDILHRQFLLGGSDLKAIKLKKERIETAEERLKFIKHFYVYCRTYPDFKVRWSEWKQQNIINYASTTKE